MEQNIEQLQLFSSWVTIIISLCAAILIMNLWVKFNSDRRNFSIDGTTSEKALLYFAGALTVWFVAGVTSRIVFYLYPELPRNNPEMELTRSIFSSVNSLALLLASSYMQFVPKLMLNSMSNIRKASRIAFLMTIIVSFVIYKNGNCKYLHSPDTLLSTLTIAIFGYALFITFSKTGLLLVANFSIISLFVLYFTQPYFETLFNENQFAVKVLALCGRISIILSICLLAYGWAHSELIKTVTRYVETTKQYKELETNLRNVEEATWQDVAATAAHKIGNPIDAIDVYRSRIIKLLKNKSLSGIREILDDMDESIEEAKKVLIEFKSLTTLHLRVESYDLIKVIKSSLRRVQQSDGAILTSCEIVNKKMKEVTVRTTTSGPYWNETKAEESIVIPMDRDKLKQCFDELISNSLHFLKEEKSKSITFTLTFITTDLPEEILKNESYFLGKEYILIEYCDSGCGIPNSNKLKIFSPFFTTYHHGTGLGMSIVKKIIDLHNGLITEDGVEGEGAQFKIYLPTNK